MFIFSCGTEKHSVDLNAQSASCNCNDLYYDDLYAHFYVEDRTEPYTGICETFYKSNKKMKLHKEFKNGKVDGVLKTYYENGILKEESQFELNFQHGFKKEYLPSGELFNHTVFRKGELQEIVFP